MSFMQMIYKLSGMWKHKVTKKKYFKKITCRMKKSSNFAPGEMAEWSIAAVLKTVVPRGTGGSNPSFSAKTHSKEYKTL